MISYLSRRSRGSTLTRPADRYGRFDGGRRGAGLFR
jgi:hypothetical protein